jgi:hypothetical protein
MRAADADFFNKSVPAQHNAYMVAREQQTARVVELRTTRRHLPVATHALRQPPTTLRKQSADVERWGL